MLYIINSSIEKQFIRGEYLYLIIQYYSLNEIFLILSLNYFLENMSTSRKNILNFNKYLNNINNIYFR